MSKAFTKEDAAPDAVVPARAPLPEGVTNYVTPRGLSLLRGELERTRRERARLESANVDADSLQARAAAETRLAELDERVASAVVVEQSAVAHDEVRLGAWVTVQTSSGQSRRFQIVGVDEADAAAGRIAFVSPMARALLGKSVGDEVTVRTPRGAFALEVVAIDYEPSVDSFDSR